jgi:hypothetical protein
MHEPSAKKKYGKVFVQGCRITNNTSTSQENTKKVSSWKHKAFMLKVNIAKAFGCKFITRALARKGLHGNFELIHKCNSTPKEFDYN